MHASPTGSQASVFPNFKSFGLSEVPWWMLCCRVYARSFSWRQLPAQVRVQEVEAEQGPCPPSPNYPPEPMFTGDPTRSVEIQKFNTEHRAWNETVLELSQAYQDKVRGWESKGMQLSQRWDLSPVPELAPFDSRPPELREWIPVKVFENQVMRSQKAQRIPTTTRNWQHRDGQWQATMTRGEAWKPYATAELQRLLQSEACIHLPETLILVVPGGHFLDFLNQLDREALALVRCRWDPEAGQLVQVGAVPQTFVQPAVEIVASVALSGLGTLPITRWPGVPEELDRLKGWQPGQQVPVTRAQCAALESWISAQPSLPRWYLAPEYRSLAAVNLCCTEAMGIWDEDYLWRPLLDGVPAGVPGTPGPNWGATL
jgi:hypothetical protein